MMKKLITVTLALALVLCLGACGSPKNVREISFEGTELTVTLGTDKATGFEWDFQIDGDCIEQSINRSFKLTGLDPNIGEVSIGFEGLSEGNATITFSTPVGWDGSGEGSTYVVNVSVGADGTILSAEEAGE